MKSVFGIVGTLFAIAYCGGLVFYFLDLTGSMHEAGNQGLGPTVMGLSGIGAIFVVVLVFQVTRLILKARATGGGNSDTPRGGDKGGFDANAAFDRYMASRPNDAQTTPPPVKPSGGPATPTGFGRKK